MKTAILLLAGTVAAASLERRDCRGFAASCGPAYSSNGPESPDMMVFSTYCLDEDGERNYNTGLRINDCLTNTFGQLAAGTGFAYSCHDFGIDRLSHNLFHATCGDGHGGEKTTTIDLNDFLCNIDGNLQCHG